MTRSDSYPRSLVLLHWLVRCSSARSRRHRAMGFSQRGQLIVRR
jgi:hypothetical protein